jgi:hypothetical protein
MRNSAWISGEHLFVCDVCGFEYYSEKKLIRWDGLVVCPKDYEPRHPQDFVRAQTDSQGVNNPRPDSTHVFLDEYSGVCTAETRSAIPGYAMPGCSIPGTPNITNP